MINKYLQIGLTSFVLAGIANITYAADAKLAATAVTDPSPMNLCEPCTITIRPDGDLGKDVYIFSWAGELAGKTGYNMGWNDAISEKYRMTPNGDGSYSYTITESYQEWFKISDEQAKTLKEIGVIARSETQQTVDCIIPCVYIKTYFSGGRGTAEQPFKISKAKDLNELAAMKEFWTSEYHFIQTANIALEGRHTPIGNSVTPFAGTYNGDGYSITGLDVWCPAG